ncbi:hypothetical protein CLOM_g13289 [Closterium sp. NIES-68]|nr:hypothetical protein CLOM_g13289 [Closterium sp. NIES-68]
MSASGAAAATATAAAASLKQRRPPADGQQPAVAADEIKNKAKPRGASPRRRSGWLVLLVIVVSAAAAAGAGYLWWREYGEYSEVAEEGDQESAAASEKAATRPKARKAQWQADKLWRAEELAKYNGSQKGLPLLLGILGDVFDVSKGKKHYGKGQGYNHFAGRDASRAFVSGNFSGDGLTDDLEGLTGEQCIGIADWRDFYFKTYIHVGKLVGRFYDEQGRARDALGEFEVLLKEGKRLRGVAKAVEKKYPGCNSRWAQNEGGKVWCDSGVPRKIPRMPEAEGGPVGGSEDTRCACFSKEQLASRNDLQEYDGCDPEAIKCVSSPPEDPNAAAAGDGSEEDEE